MPNKLWVHGVCDNILEVLQYWISNYEKGKITATRRYLTKPGELGPAPQEIDKPTRKSLELPWREVDLKKFVEVLDEVIPHNHETYALVRDLKHNLHKWKNGKILPGGARKIEIDWYFKHVVQVYRIFEALKYDRPLNPPTDMAEVDLEKIANG